MKTKKTKKTKKTRKSTPAGRGYPDVAKALVALESLLRYASYPTAMVREINVDEIGSCALETLRYAFKDYTDLLDEKVAS